MWGLTYEKLSSDPHWCYPTTIQKEKQPFTENTVTGYVLYIYVYSNDVRNGQRKKPADITVRPVWARGHEKYGLFYICTYIHPYTPLYAPTQYSFGHDDLFLTAHKELFAHQYSDWNYFLYAYSVIIILITNPYLQNTFYKYSSVKTFFFYWDQLDLKSLCFSDKIYSSMWIFFTVSRVPHVDSGCHKFFCL